MPGLLLVFVVGAVMVVMAALELARQVMLWRQGRRLSRPLSNWRR